ncbi:MAG: hypothetical protein P1S60_11650 [Anaerolineae bacterium]|nr:hypothetical protein [Anaerolineae bacterium]
MKAAFTEIEITPPLGTLKIGWLKRIVSDSILAPLFARIAILIDDKTQIAFVQLDTLFIGMEEVKAIRMQVEALYGFPGSNMMIAATHNHAGPALDEAGEVPKDEAYAASLVEKIVTNFGEALVKLEDVEVGFAHLFEWDVAHNRRVVMRDGTVRTHGSFDDPEALFIEGPIDPEIAVLAIRTLGQQLLGVLVNFACHPTHYGGDGTIHPGFPGAMAAELKLNGCPTALFLNGASGNVHTANPAAGGHGMDADAVGHKLATDVLLALDNMAYQNEMPLSASHKYIDLPYRQVSDEEKSGFIRGAQRFVDSEIYDRTIPALLEIISREKCVHVEIQTLGIGEIVFVAVPAELFVEYGLAIKHAAYPAHALVVSCANGHIGYIPTAEAFQRGGYETTFGPGSKMATQAGEIMLREAKWLINRLRG